MQRNFVLDTTNFSTNLVLNEPRETRISGDSQLKCAVRLRSTLVVNLNLPFITFVTVRGANWPSFTDSAVEPSLCASIPKIPRAFHSLIDSSSTLTSSKSLVQASLVHRRYLQNEARSSSLDSVGFNDNIVR